MGELFVVSCLLNLGLLVTHFAARGRKLLRLAYLHELLLVWILLYAVGASYVVLFERATPANEELAFMAQASLLSYLVTCQLLAVSQSHLLETDFYVSEDLSPQASARARVNLYSVATLSAVVCLIFIYGVIAQGEMRTMLLAVFTGDENYLEIRKAITTGRIVYLAPGYVKQFRDILLPASIAAIFVYDARPNRLLLAFCVVAGLSAAVLSGQRYVVVVTLLCIGAGVLKRRRRTQRGPSLAGPLMLGGAFLAYVAMTILLGRAKGNQGALDLLGAGLGNLFERLVVVAPSENMRSFPYWSTLAPTYGMNWLGDLATIAPGSQASMSSALHERIGGSVEGNSPLALPADVYLAWGFPGCLLIPPLYAVALFVIDVRLRSRPTPFNVGVRMLALLTSQTWWSPYLFLLNGGIVVLFAFGTSFISRTPESQDELDDEPKPIEAES